ncbi:hypothetical protein GE061_000222 [Apolygus lucorum]|uniref:Regulatory protein zeste n=1 Tax=Apolygus lucorum TaxID=248454 RepID=A0A8S9Y3S0_APOLU|nr:hypothetical protein GE061_000222 [Apolygus lucorum]
MNPAKVSKREPSFSTTEREMICDLVQNHWAVLENKKTDNHSVHEKTTHWKMLAEEFNSTSSQYRDWTKLKTLWENMKKRAKSALADAHDNLYVTGGGKGKSTTKDPILLKVMDLIRPQVEPLENEFDNDYVEDVNTIIIDEEMNSDPTSLLVVHDEVTSNKTMEVAMESDWSHYNPSMLKTPRTSVLRTGTEINISPDNGVIQEEIVDSVDPLISHPRRSLGHSRRRPVLKQPQANALLEAKITTLLSATGHANDQHAIELEILKLRREQEMVKLDLKREKLIRQKLRSDQEKIKLDLKREKLTLQKLRTEHFKKCSGGQCCDSDDTNSK